MSTTATKDLLKKWADVRAMVLKWHPNQTDVSRVKARSYGYKKPSDTFTLGKMIGKLEERCEKSPKPDTGQHCSAAAYSKWVTGVLDYCSQTPS
ncbi:hypothetical protein TNCV_626691 [Trichonephila clavipes]|nr:hypothetical protein TNCV_626691 [Trichonephila clavipes]